MKFVKATGIDCLAVAVGTVHDRQGYELLKGSRYLVLTSRQNLHSRELEAVENNRRLHDDYAAKGLSIPPGERLMRTGRERRLGDLLAANSDLNVAYTMLDQFKYAYDVTSSDVMSRGLADWYRLARQSKVPEIIRFADTIRSHEDSATVLVVDGIFSGEVIPVLSKQIFDEYHVMAYYREVAAIIGQHSEEDTQKDFLKKQYGKLEYIDDQSVLATILQSTRPRPFPLSSRFVFPFGLNKSQYKAVDNAFSSSVSIIEGPPGTGKTQTILTIIANAIMQGKRIAVCSNNNEAVRNVYEKLEAAGYGGVVAMAPTSSALGSPL